MKTLHINCSYFNHLSLSGIIKFVGDLNKLPDLKELSEKCDDYKLGYFSAVSGVKGDLLELPYLCNGAFMCGWTDAKKEAKEGKIFVVKQRYGKAFILKCQKDGDSFCCFGTEFTDLQSSSDYCFGSNFYSAVRGYIEMKNKQVEMQDVSEQSKFKVVSKLEIAQNQINQLKQKLSCAEAYETQLRTEFQNQIDKLHQQIKDLQFNLMNVTTHNKVLIEEKKKLKEEVQKKHLSPEKFGRATRHAPLFLDHSNGGVFYTDLIEENAELKKALETCRKQLSNYENTTKTLLEENQQFKRSINFNRNNNPVVPNLSHSSILYLSHKYTEFVKINDSTFSFEGWLRKIALDSVNKKSVQDNSTFAKISDATLEKLYNTYCNSKKSQITFDSWLYNCVRDSISYNEAKKFF